MSSSVFPSDTAIPRIFVSHSHQDNAYCRTFVQLLREALGDEDAVWYDEHNLGWGALRTVIDRELQARQHFIAIFSPAAVASEWVNAEIDAALYLLGKGKLQTILFVTAERCDVSPLLQRYKRIERPDGSGYSPQEAVARVLPVVRPVVRATMTASPVLSPSPPPPLRLITLPPDRLPAKLVELGFAAYEQEGAAFILPPLCPVPAGSFLMGSDPRRDKDAQSNEQPVHNVDVPAFQIARYPVTVAEYACFLRAGHREPAQVYLVVDWRTLARRQDHPFTGITWHDATAYAAWLAERTGQPWRLPTEAEWEKAARWDASRGVARLYPWGDVFDKARCNTHESGVGTTTAVYAYPNGASPYGALDMAGNVWEWTSTLFQPYPYSWNDGRENPNSFEYRVLRGSSGNLVTRFARAACRLRNWPDGRSNYLGFRLAVGPVRAGS